MRRIEIEVDRQQRRRCSVDEKLITIRQLDFQFRLPERIAIGVDNNCILGRISIFNDDLGIRIVKPDSAGNIYTRWHSCDGNKFCQVYILCEVDACGIRQYFDDGAISLFENQ